MKNPSIVDYVFEALSGPLWWTLPELADYCRARRGQLLETSVQAALGKIRARGIFVRTRQRKPNLWEHTIGAPPDGREPRE